MLKRTIIIIIRSFFNIKYIAVFIFLRGDCYLYWWVELESLKTTSLQDHNNLLNWYIIDSLKGDFFIY